MEGNVLEPSEGIAHQIAASPRLRAAFLEDSTAAISRLAPKASIEMRGAIAETVKQRLDEESPSIVNAATIQHQFFSDAMRNPRLAFRVLLVLAVITFAAGLCLIVGATLAFFFSDKITDKVFAGILDGAGVITALSSVYALARRGVSDANTMDTRLRLIVADYSNEMANLLCISQKAIAFETVREINGELRKTMAEAVRALDSQFSVDRT